MQFDERRQRVLEPAGVQNHVAGHARRAPLPVEVARVHGVAEPILREPFKGVETVNGLARRIASR